MDESDDASDDPFADVAPVPEWDELPDADAVFSAPVRPAPPKISAAEVAPPALPPPVGGAEETDWSVQGVQPRPDLLPLVSDAGSNDSAVIVDAPVVAEPVPVEAPVPAGESNEAAFEFPPDFFGDQPVEPEPEPEPIIDLSTRDTAGLVSNIAGPFVWIVGLGAAWYLLTRQPDPIVAPRNWPTPRDTWDALRALAEEDAARTTARETIQRLLAAAASGATVGLLLGNLTGTRRIVRNLLRPAIGVFRIVSPFVLLFFLFIWGGDSWWVSWAPAAVGVAALTAWSTDRALSISPRRISTVTGPATMRGIRASLILAWTLVFATEQALGLDGIFTAMAKSSGSMPDVVAWLAVAAVLALILDALLRLFEHLLARG